MTTGKSLVAHLERVDAAKNFRLVLTGRGIQDDDLRRLWNRRGSVACAAQVTERLCPDVVSASNGIRQNGALLQLERWTGVETRTPTEGE